MYSRRLGTVENPAGRQLTATSVPWRAGPVSLLPLVCRIYCMQ
jgi:hypothetical protein